MSKWKNFKKEKVSSLLGHTEVRFEQIPPEATKPTSPLFTVVASSRGLYISGHMIGFIENMAELDEFAQVVSDAWVEHLKLKPKLTKTLSGH